MRHIDAARVAKRRNQRCKWFQMTPVWSTTIEFQRFYRGSTSDGRWTGRLTGGAAEYNDARVIRYMFLSFDTPCYPVTDDESGDWLAWRGAEGGFQKDRAVEGTFRYPDSAVSAILFLTPFASA